MGHSDHEALRRRLGELEAEHARLCAQLSRLGGAGARLPGLFLAVEAQGGALLVPAAMVVEVVRVVACAPLSGAPAHVLGTFVYRGTPAVAVELSRRLGSERPTPLDARMLVLRASRPVGLVVDRVATLVEDPVVHPPDRQGLDAGPWAGSDLVAALCQSGALVAPLLDVTRLLEGAVSSTERSA